MLTVEWKGLDKMISDLRTARTKAVPYAVKSALNTAAFEGRKIWQQVQREEFTIRSAYVQRMTLVDQAKGTDPDKLKAVLGSATPFMGDQESGALVAGKSGQKGIPAPTAAGLPSGSHRTRLVRAGNRLARLNAFHPRAASVHQRNAIAIAMAIRHRTGLALLENKQGGKKLFRVSGGQRRWDGKKFRIRSLKVRQLWDFTKRAVRVPGSHTLEKTLKRLEPKLPHMYQAALLEQLRRHHVLGY
jgi:hypothetical protein